MDAQKSQMNNSSQLSEKDKVTKNNQLLIWMIFNSSYLLCVINFTTSSC